jgi:hypothetical protein
VIHPDVEVRFIDDRMGYGLFAHRFIPRGTITWVRDPFDRALGAGEIARLDPFWQAVVDKYSFVDRRGDHVLCWDLARYMNHSCAPSSMCAGWEFEIALRDLGPGDQLTDDYGTLNLGEPFACSCGEAGCRGLILPGDFEAHGARWDALVREAFPSIGAVPQPLMHLVADRAEVEAAVADPARIRSCRENSFPANARR